MENEPNPTNPPVKPTMDAVGAAPINAPTLTPPATPTTPLADPQAPNAYAKKGGWKKWLIIYIVAAIIIYGIIYFWYRADHASGTNTSSGTSTPSLY